MRIKFPIGALDDVARYIPKTIAELKERKKKKNDKGNTRKPV